VQEYHGSDFGKFENTWVRRRELWVHLRAPASTSDKSGSADDKSGCADDKSGRADDKSGSADHKSGSADDKPGSTSNHCRAVWEKHLLWECCWCAWKSLLLLIIQQFLKLMYSVCILIYVFIWQPIHTRYIWTGCTRCLRAI